MPNTSYSPKSDIELAIQLRPPSTIQKNGFAVEYVFMITPLHQLGGLLIIQQGLFTISKIERRILLKIYRIKTHKLIFYTKY